MLGVIVKVEPLLSTPLAWTTTFPVVAPVGTGITIDVALQVPPGAKFPLKETVLIPRFSCAFPARGPCPARNLRQESKIEKYCDALAPAAEWRTVEF